MDRTGKSLDKTYTGIVGGEGFYYQQGDDKPRAAPTSWYRGKHTNFLPNKANLKESGAIEKYVLQGWLPKKPFISKKHVITAFGSCFAVYIKRNLKAWGYRTASGPKRALQAHIITNSAGINNTFAMRQQFDWVWEGKKFNEVLWYDEDKKPYLAKPEIQENTKRIFDNTDVFIFTLGLSEVWCNRKTDEVFWRAIPHNKFNPKIHGFRISSCYENLKNLIRIYSLIRMYRKDAHIIFTVSPIPLIATFRPVSCITANCVSKSILRVAIDELIRMHPEDDKLFYYPSYEIATALWTDPYDASNRHLRPVVIKTIMEKFAENYLKDGHGEVKCRNAPKKPSPSS